MRLGNKGPFDHLLCATFVCGCDAPVRVGEIDCGNGLEDGFDWVTASFDDVLSFCFDIMEVDRGMDDCDATIEGDDVEKVGFLAVVGCLMGCETDPNDCDTPSVGGVNGPQFWMDGSEDLGDGSEGLGDFDAPRLDLSSVAKNVLLVL